MDKFLWHQSAQGYAQGIKKRKDKRTGQMLSRHSDWGMRGWSVLRSVPLVDSGVFGWSLLMARCQAQSLCIISLNKMLKDRHNRARQGRAR